MSFINPLFLLGILLISIPIIIHLLTKKKAKRIEFAPVFLVKEAYKQKINISRLKNFIILLLRCLTIIFLSAAFAKPIITTSFTIPFLLPKFEENKDVVLILDNSYSMDYDNRFGKAKQIALDIINNFNEKDYASLILTSDEEKIKSYQLINNFEYLKKEVINSKIRENPANIKECIEAAAAILKKGKNRLKTIYIFSDMQKIAWENVKNLNLNDDIKIYCLNFSTGDEKNLYFKLVSKSTDYLFKDETARIIYKICSYGKIDNKKIFSSVLVNNKTVQKNLVYIDKELLQEFTFKEKGLHTCMLKLPPDNLNYDNKLKLEFNVKDKIKVLLVKDEATPYIKLALDSDKIKVKECSSYEFNTKNLEEHDVLILSGIKKLSLTKLRKLISKNKNILVFLSDEIDKEFYQDKLLPVNIIKIDNISIEKTNLENIDFNHTIFKELNKLVEDEEKIEFHKYYQLITKENIYSKVLARFANNIPFIIEVTTPNNKILIFNTTINEKYTNLQFNPVFAPLLHNIIHYLCVREEKEKTIYEINTKESQLERINIKELKNIEFLPIKDTIEYLKKYANKVELTRLMIILSIFLLSIEMFLLRKEK